MMNDGHRIISASGTCVAERPTKHSAQAATDQPPNRPVHRSNERSTDQLTQHCAHFTTKTRRESTPTNRTLGPYNNCSIWLVCFVACSSGEFVVIILGVVVVTILVVVSFLLLFVVIHLVTVVVILLTIVVVFIIIVVVALAVIVGVI